MSADFRDDGSILPRELVWEDGSRYVIDRVVDVRPAVAAKAGGQGDRYTIEGNGHMTYLFFERGVKSSGNNLGRWFLERKR